jgi:protein-ribulosamine 3-kinase
MNLAIPSILASDLEKLITQREGRPCRMIAFEPTGGGSINYTGKISLTHGEFFIKWNDREKFPDMLFTEAKGLELLANATDLQVPIVIACGESGPFQYLMLSYIESSTRQNNYWEKLASGIANVHRTNALTYGLGYSNYIGSLPQSNLETASWTNFFISERLEKQVQLAVRNGRCESEMRMHFNRLYEKLGQYLIEEKPCLVHGDLWSGNVVVSESGTPVLIDPAVYFGNREMDLAMSKLFGGFDPDFYRMYANCYPLENGLNERIEIYNLYPLLVHLNLFGGSYYQQIMDVLRRFAG